MQIVTSEEFEQWLREQVSQENLQRALKKAQEDGNVLLDVSGGEIDAGNHSMLAGVSKRIATILELLTRGAYYSEGIVTDFMTALSGVVPFGQEVHGASSSLGFTVLNATEDSQVRWVVSIGEVLEVLGLMKA